MLFVVIVVVWFVGGVVDDRDCIVDGVVGSVVMRIFVVVNNTVEISITRWSIVVIVVVITNVVVGIVDSVVERVVEIVGSFINFFIITRLNIIL